MSRASRTSFLGRTLEAATAIAPIDDPNVVAPNSGVRVLQIAMALGAGRALTDRLRRTAVLHHDAKAIRPARRDGERHAPRRVAAVAHAEQGDGTARS